MRQLSDNQPTVESFLATLGAGNWGGPPQAPTRATNLPTLEFGETPTLITRYLSERRCRLTPSLILVQTTS